MKKAELHGVTRARICLKTEITVNYKLKIFESPKIAALAFAEYLLEQTKKVIEEFGVCNVALSGGSTPKLLFDLISENYAEKFDWINIHFFWGDERCVPPKSSQSNFGMTNSHLLKHIKIPEQNIHRIRGENDPAKEAEYYSDILKLKIRNKTHNHIPKFDLLILGMGDDGHTASIFPDQIELWNSNNLCVVAEHPESGEKRISVTGKIINNSSKVVFLITGKNKSEVLSKIINKENGYLNYPAAHVNPVSGEVDFYIDKYAANKLK